MDRLLGQKHGSGANGDKTPPQRLRRLVESDNSNESHDETPHRTTSRIPPSGC
jgi:hypothetical protein